MRWVDLVVLPLEGFFFLQGKTRLTRSKKVVNLSSVFCRYFFLIQYSIKYESYRDFTVPVLGRDFLTAFQVDSIVFVHAPVSLFLNSMEWFTVRCWYPSLSIDE